MSEPRDGCDCDWSGTDDCECALAERVTLLEGLRTGVLKLAKEWKEATVKLMSASGPGGPKAIAARSAKASGVRECAAQVDALVAEIDRALKPLA